MTGPAVPPGGEELREAIAQAIWDGQMAGAGLGWDDVHPALEGGREQVRRVADRVLALPEMRDALAAQEKLRQVEALAEELQGTAEITGGRVNGFVFADRLRGLS